MRIADYRRLAEDAKETAEQTADVISRAVVLFEASRTIPRLPVLSQIHVDLLLPILDAGIETTAPAVVADCCRVLTRLAIAMGAIQVADEIATNLETLAKSVDEPRVRASASLARGSVLAAQEKLPGARAELEAARAAAGDRFAADYAYDLGTLEAALSVATKDHAAAEALLTGVLEHLGTQGPEWDGERYDTQLRLAFAHVARDEVPQAIARIEAARSIALDHGDVPDAAQCVLSLAPMMQVTGRVDDGLRLLETSIDACAATPDSPGPLEMALWNLRMRLLETRGDVAGSLTAGFRAIERCGQVGSVDDYLGFVTHMASLYQRSGAVVDAYHMLDMAHRGLSSRGDAAPQVEVVSRAIEAFRTDVGDARFRQIVEEVERLDPGR